MDPDIHNSNPGVFRGSQLPLRLNTQGFSEDEALEAVRRFVGEYGQLPTAMSWRAAGMTPSEHTIRRRFGSFQAAIAAALNDRK